MTANINNTKDSISKTAGDHPILVTGGAGYIGSHMVDLLQKSGRAVIVVDNLSTGFRDAVKDAIFYEENVGNSEAIANIIHKHGIQEVLHFAAHTVVPESVENPYKYYQNNTFNTLNLIRTCQNHGVKSFIFSSTAAVYGTPENPKVTENTPTAPINPYGQSKLLSEIMLRDMTSAQDGMQFVILRYFNVAGAHPDLLHGQRTKDATHLVKVVSECATGKRDKIHIFGNDLPTEDGTPIRDYIHVSDLASAHLDALDYLTSGGKSNIFNVGYGHGYSVKAVINTANQFIDTPINAEKAPPRAGDPVALIADNTKIKETLNWQPQYDDLSFIVKTAIEWEKRLS